MSDFEFNINSSQQVAEFLYDFLKLNPVKQTSGGKSGIQKNSVDASVIQYHAEKDNNEFCRLLLDRRKIEKANGTTVAGLKRFIIDHGEGLYKIHPDFWLNIVETYRSSSSDPNG